MANFALYIIAPVILFAISFVSFVVYFLKYGVRYELWLEGKELDKKKKWHYIISEALIFPLALDLTQYYWRGAESKGLDIVIPIGLLCLLILTFLAPATRFIAALFARLLSKFKVFAKIRIQ